MQVFYDGECPVCAREVGFVRRELQRAGTTQRVQLVDAQQAQEDTLRRHGLDREQVLGRMHGVDEQGRVIQGVEVFRQMYRHTRWGGIWSVTGWPGVRPVADKLYEVFAKYRPYLRKLSKKG